MGLLVSAGLRLEHVVDDRDDAFTDCILHFYRSLPTFSSLINSPSPPPHTPPRTTASKMSNPAPYELAFQLHGHASDVRSLCAPSPDVPLLLSGSRDGSALLWGPGRGREWDVKLRVEAPEKKYVSCVGLTKWQGEGKLSHHALECRGRKLM